MHFRKMYSKDHADEFTSIALKKERNCKGLEAKQEIQALRVPWVLLEEEETPDQLDLQVLFYVDKVDIV